MSDLFRLAPGGMRTIISRNQDANAILDDSLTRLGQILTEHHGCWGDDVPGKAFAGSFLAPLRELQANSGRLIANVDLFNEEIDTVIENFVHADDDNARGVEAV